MFFTLLIYYTGVTYIHIHVRKLNKRTNKDREDPCSTRHFIRWWG